MRRQYIIKSIRCWPTVWLRLSLPSRPCGCPPWSITGDEDFGNGPKMAAAIANEIAGTQLLVLKGLRHMALAEDPASIYQPLRAFSWQVFNGDDGDSTSGQL